MLQNQLSPVRQQVSFPEVAIIRKGTPKAAGKPRDGKPTWIQGRDLGEKFRIQFLPGTGGLEPDKGPDGSLIDSPRSAFHRLYEKNYVRYDQAKFNAVDGYEVKTLRAMIPFRDAFYGWYWANEAYNAGRQIAMADDNFYITKRDPLTGEYLVRNGEDKDGNKYRFMVGDTITYERGNRSYSIPVKFHGRLRLFLPDVGQFVSFTLKTTSFYDRPTIEQGLGSIAGMADTLNDGIAGGVPFWLYRAQQDVCWNHSDGTASRVKIWSVFLRIDEVWAKASISRLQRLSMGERVAGMLANPIPADIIQPAQPDIITGPVDPSAETYDDEAEAGLTADEIIEGDADADAERDYQAFYAQERAQSQPKDDSEVKPVTYKSNAPKRLQGPSGGPIAWLMSDEVGIVETSQAAMIANKLKLTERGLTKTDWATRYSNYCALLDGGKKSDEAAALAIQGKEA